MAKKSNFEQVPLDVVKKVLEKQVKPEDQGTKGQKLKRLKQLPSVDNGANGKGGKRDSDLRYFSSRKLRRALACISDKP
jgi:hypothetical protein